MKIIVEMNDTAIKQACYLVESHHNSDDFIEKLFPHAFNMANFKDVRAALYTTQDKIFYVREYKTFNPWSRVVGHYSNGVCYINSRMKLSLKDRVENIFHEICGHGLGFKHNGNRVNKFNLETFPYKGSKIFVKYLESIGKL